MNAVIETIHGRRSVRRFEKKPISREILEEILKAGNAAPSGANGQPWRFVVVEDPAFLKDLAARSLPFYRKWLEKMPEAFKAMRREVDAVTDDPVYYSAPAVVFVIGSGGGSMDYDCSLVCGNMMLAARSFGIGSCWVFIGQLVLAEEDVRRAFGLKEGEKVYGPLLLGYPREGFPPAPPKKPAAVTWI